MFKKGLQTNANIMLHHARPPSPTHNRSPTFHSGRLRKSRHPVGEAGARARMCEARRGSLKSLPSKEICWYSRSGLVQLFCLRFVRSANGFDYRIKSVGFRSFTTHSPKSFHQLSFPCESEWRWRQLRPCLFLSRR